MNFLNGFSRMFFIFLNNNNWKFRIRSNIFICILSRGLVLQCILLKEYFNWFYIPKLNFRVERNVLSGSQTMKWELVLELPPLLHLKLKKSLQLSFSPSVKWMLDYSIKSIDSPPTSYAAILPLKSLYFLDSNCSMQRDCLIYHFDKKYG